MRRLFLVVFAIGSSLLAKAQDPITSQSMSTYTELNPSFMGKDSSNVAYLNHRNQWPKIQGNYVTTRFGYHHYLSKTNGYLGLSLMRDDAGSGTLTTTNLALNYTQNIKVRKVFIKVGAKSSYNQKVLDWSKLTFGDQIDQQLGFTSSTSQYRQGQQAISYLDFSVGSSIYWKGFTIGAAFFHVLEPSNGFITFNSSVHPRVLSLQLSKTFTTDIKGHDLDITPHVMYSKQRDFKSNNTGLLSTYRFGILGFSYRYGDAFNTIIGFKTKYVKVIYSYDHTVSKLAPNSGGSHEISLILHPFQKKKKAHKNLVSVKSPFML
ncbi:MAG: type IX secretion system PorP/SprF family membrane protein [Glaciecola sp.]|jgi:type IX secretion system PorP/SprF family membrane protein